MRPGYEAEKGWLCGIQGVWLLPIECNEVYQDSKSHTPFNNAKTQVIITFAR